MSLNLQSLVSWNSAISVAAKQCRGDEALRWFLRMLCHSICPNALTFLCILKSCGSRAAIDKGKEIHAQILSSGFLESNLLLGTALLHMYVKCGLLSEAQHVHATLCVRDAISWSALISGHVQECQCHEALEYFGRMQAEGLSPNAITFTCTLKACGIKGAMEKGKQIHSVIVGDSMLKHDLLLGTALVDMYVKCGVVVNAHRVHDQLYARDTVSWSALIVGYVQHGQGCTALACFWQMVTENLFPDAVIFVCILKACGSIAAVKWGKHIHVAILSQHLDKDTTVRIALQDMYSECGQHMQAQQLHEELGVRDVASCNARIAGYVQQGRGHEALNLFECMQSEGLPPNTVTFICSLKACSITGAIEKGQEIHNKIVNSGILEEDVVLGTALVDMYAKFGLLTKAEQIHNELCAHDVISWSALISGYVQHGEGSAALNCFEQMKSEGFAPDAITFISVLKACGMTGAINKAKQIHNEIVGRGFLDKHTMLGTAVVNMYAKCGDFNKAWEVHEDFCIQNVASWSALISGYQQHGQADLALMCFEQMQDEGLSPDAITFICALKACSSTGAIDKGKQIHDELVSRNLLKHDVVLVTSLVSMYAKCGELAKAQQVHNEFGVRNIVSWNALIVGYAQQGQGLQALNCLELMQSEGLCPNATTYICILKACCIPGDIKEEKHIHDISVGRGLLETDILLQTMLVDMYAKRGLLAKAQEVHDKLDIQDIISWSTLIVGYVQDCQCHEALKCFEQMEGDIFSLDAVVFTCILKACGSIGAIEKGKQIHKEIVIRGLLDNNVVLGTALVDMYGKCGLLSKAHQVFEELRQRNVVSWSALIANYAQQRQGHEALCCFEQMQSEGICPDRVTFLCVLNACNQSLLLDEFQMCFGHIIRNCSIKLNIETYIYKIICFGCAGHFPVAMSVIKTLPSHDFSAVWPTLLGACKKWGNMKVGKWAFDQVVQLDDSCATSGNNYVAKAQCR